MPKIKYVERKFSERSRNIITIANEIIDDYKASGFDLTLRQLYYQFVSRNHLPNTDREYKNLGGIINDARLAGEIDWEAITDRTRQLEERSHWETPGDIIRDAERAFHHDLWEKQTYRLECWIEKDALKGVIEGVCSQLDVPYFSCRGYTSQSEMWNAAQRLIAWHEAGYETIILHLGDHDPSGIDMTRDISDRLCLFNCATTVKRIALNHSQIKQYRPPPNPAKITDSRARDYIRDHGRSSWELDALEPQVIVALIRKEIESYIDKAAWAKAKQKLAEHKAVLKRVAANWQSL
jgi:hypothetical protein